MRVWGVMQNLRDVSRSRLFMLGFGMGFFGSFEQTLSGFLLISR
jgi:hypothetical protein